MASSWSQAIRRNTILLISLIIVLGICITGYVAWNKEQSEKLLHIANDFHLASAFQCQSIRAEVRQLLTDLIVEHADTEGAIRGRIDELGPAFNKSTSLHLISQDIERLWDRQRRFSDGGFTTILEKLERQFASLDRERNTWDEDDVKSYTNANRLQSLIVTTSQLERLHIVRYRELLREQESNQSDEKLTFLVLISAMVLVGFGILRMGFRTIDSVIGDQKKAEEALRRSGERYRELFDDSPVGIWEDDWSDVKRMVDGLSAVGVTDLREHFSDNPDKLREAYDLAKIVDISRATRQLFGAPNKQVLIERTMADSISREEIQGFLGSVIAFAGGELSHEFESAAHDYTGVALITSNRVVIPPNHLHDWSRVIYAIEDITDRKGVEEQLRRAQRMEAVGQLTGGIAHDFNNLLAIVMGNTELLQDELGTDSKALQVIFRAAERGSELTQRLLAFSRQQPLAPRAVDPSALVEEMGDLLRRTLGEIINVEIVSEPGLWHAQVDPGQLESALLNLALNARDAMRQGGKVRIESSNAILDETYAATHTEVSSGDYVLITVDDSGIGMSPTVQAHALEPFYTTKGVGEGSGLGLPMVYGFAKQSGGDLVISSEEGRGTTIALYLPRADELRERRDPFTNAKLPDGSGETVLVIEDEPEVLALAEALLTTLGYRVLTAKDGSAGLNILKQKPKIDLLLSDVVLPGGMNGPDFAEEAKRHKSNLKILFMSGYTEGFARAQSSLPDGAGLLNKPFQRRELAEKVRAALDI